MRSSVCCRRVLGRCSLVLQAQPTALVAVCNLEHLPCRRAGRSLLLASALAWLLDRQPTLAGRAGV